MSLSSPWRSDFPALATLTAQQHTYLDSAATTQKPQLTLDALSACYRQGIANVHRAQHLLAQRTTDAFETTRQQLADWFGVADAQQILFTHGTTEAINLLAYGLEHLIQPNDEIIVTALEHHANLLPWQQLAKRRQARLIVLPLTPQGMLDLAKAHPLIGPRARLLAVSQLSNVLGSWQPLAELLPLARAQGALTVVDGAQGAVHGRHNLPALDCDFYALSSHKLYGPDGVGMLYGRPAALKLLQPWQFGGEMVRSATYHSADFQPAPLGFEAGTPSISGVIGLGATLNYLKALDQAAVSQHEQALHHHLLEGLQARPGIHIIGQPQTALVSFNVAGAHPADLAHLLAEQGIAVRSGSHCAMPLFQTLGLKGAIRVSLGLYNNGDDLQRFFAALDHATALLV